MRKEINDGETRKQAEVLIRVRLLPREGAEVLVCKGKKSARMRTRSILCGENNTIIVAWRTCKYKTHQQ